MKALFTACLIASTLAVPAFAVEEPGPERAIAMAARAAPAPVRGVFEMDIKSVGHSAGITYLNSEDDYQNQRNLAIELPASVEAELKRMLEVGDLDAALKGRHIRVNGPVMRVEIHTYLDDGTVSDKFYYQTHLFVSNTDQIRFIR
ncbi:hypothetical protein [Undibacterium terreum]|uniref:Uncharacterized protein n=1 Tax=Undibacterium terreum TaxID=1224302 RepID=A0A916UKZ8_9BURK|nr:hypothetical protein [Undibacterium terreum]GGC76548.1 hypothetical protein GCM10011396_24730 [Undibacterium terreum]